MSNTLYVHAADCTNIQTYTSETIPIVNLNNIQGSLLDNGWNDYELFQDNVAKGLYYIAKGVNGGFAIYDANRHNSVTYSKDIKSYTTIFKTDNYIPSVAYDGSWYRGTLLSPNRPIDAETFRYEYGVIIVSASGNEEKDDHILFSVNMNQTKGWWNHNAFPTLVTTNGLPLHEISDSVDYDERFHHDYFCCIDYNGTTKTNYSFGANITTDRSDGMLGFTLTIMGDNGFVYQAEYVMPNY